MENISTHLEVGSREKQRFIYVPPIQTFVSEIYKTPSDLNLNLLQCLTYMLVSVNVIFIVVILHYS